jgi:hypothetical protein
VIREAVKAIAAEMMELEVAGPGGQCLVSPATVSGARGYQPGCPGMGGVDGP